MYVSGTTRLRLTATFNIVAIALLCASSVRSAPDAGKLPSSAGQTRALVIGIDTYRFGQPLKGAVSDARDYYTLAYTSTDNSTDGKFRTIAVRVSRKDAVVNAKRGYWADVGAQ